MTKNGKNLVVVESPAKAKTIGKYLGPNYKVVASVGHVRDLPKSKLGIDIENNFEPDYINIRGKGDIIKALKKEAKDAKNIYLATDPDREGEAISWHLTTILGLNPADPHRIVFNEITKDSVKEALKNPQAVDINLVDAQQARRVLDRLVGYQISPLLWRKVRKGLSAGRVQSAALKIICDREKEIRAFIPKEYWLIQAVLSKLQEAKSSFEAKLIEKAGEKISIDNKEEADAILKELTLDTFKVGKIERKERFRRSYPPFTTSSLQQDASNKLNFYTKKTMLIAQQLYEGVEVKGQGTLGLITYIRTDSVRIANDARMSAKNFILGNFGEKYWGNNFFSNKKKDIQDAHEAIRPTRVDLEPDLIKESLSKDQYLLYKLIWGRFLASQMAPAIFDSESIDVHNGLYMFRATGSKLKFDGFLKIYQDKREEDKDRELPRLSTDEILKEEGITADQNFTQPPPRFTEASLVKDLEDKNIGRPSTYASIIATLLERKYVAREKKSLLPQELGFIVTDMMEEYFKEIVDAGFTSEMEDKLDQVEADGLDWRQLVGTFYDTLKDELVIADEKIEKIKFEDEFTGEDCDLCGRPMVVKHGRYGTFAACSGYPECKRTKPILKTTGVKCPSCGKDIVVKKGKTGKVFYGCSGYPECSQSYWYKPVNKECPQCGSLLLEKKTKSTKYECSNSQCGYKE